MASLYSTRLRLLFVGLFLVVAPLWDAAEVGGQIQSVNHPMPRPINAPAQSNSAQVFDNSIKSQRHIACGTIVTNVTSILVHNPHHPEPTFTKVICEIVVEKADRSVNKLNIRFKHLELYRANMDGQCLHDKFAVYTDLNAPMSPILCGSQTGKTLSIPFLPNQGCLIVSIITSDLDHDRSWSIEIEQSIGNK